MAFKEYGDSSTPSDAEPRRQCQPRSPHKHQPDTEVTPDSDVKEQLVNTDWQMPASMNEDVPVESTTLQEIKENHTANVGTFTHPKDFSNIQRIFSQKLKLTEEDGFIKMVDVQPRVISTGAKSEERPNTKVLLTVVSYSLFISEYRGWENDMNKVLWCTYCR